MKTVPLSKLAAVNRQWDAILELVSWSEEIHPVYGRLVDSQIHERMGRLEGNLIRIHVDLLNSN